MGWDMDGDLDDEEHQKAHQEAQEHHEVGSLLAVDLRDDVGHEKCDGIGQDPCRQGEVGWVVGSCKELDTDDVGEDEAGDEGGCEQ